MKEKIELEDSSEDVPASFVPAAMIEDSVLETSQQGKDSQAQKPYR